MTKEELAKLLDGREYRCEITKQEEAKAKAAGLVVVFGGSDDLMEFRGAIDDEVGACDGGEAFVDAKGLLPLRESIDNDTELKDFFAREPVARKIEALWCKEGEYSWTYKTEIPHATFDIGDTYDGETTPYCRGIVFALDDLK